MRIACEILLEKYGPTPLDVAEALLQGRIDETDNLNVLYVDEIVTPVILEAARLRIQDRMTKVIDATRVRIASSSTGCITEDQTLDPIVKKDSKG